MKQKISPVIQELLAGLLEMMLYQELAFLLPKEAWLNVDETGHKNNGQAMWTWCFRASLYTLFKIDASRGSDVLVAMLGKEFNGILTREDHQRRFLRAIYNDRMASAKLLAGPAQAQSLYNAFAAVSQKSPRSRRVPASAGRRPTCTLRPIRLSTAVMRSSSCPIVRSTPSAHRSRPRRAP